MKEKKIKGRLARKSARTTGVMTAKKAVKSAGYRVVYGETMPAWEQIFPTRREAEAFAKRHQSFGDIIFGITKVVPGEPPRSFAAAIAKAEAA